MVRALTTPIFEGVMSHARALFGKGGGTFEVFDMYSIVGVVLYNVGDMMFSN